MDLPTAFYTLEALLPNPKSKEAFDKVRRRILSAAGAEGVAELERKVVELEAMLSKQESKLTDFEGHLNFLGHAVEYITACINDPTPANKQKLADFIQ